MRNIIIITLLSSVFHQGIGQELNATEKENIRNNIKDIPNDSALMSAKRLIISSSFYEMSEGVKRSNQLKSLSVALEILRLIESQNLDNDDYYDWRAAGYKIIGDNEQAIIYYSKAIQINSKNVYYLQKRAECKMAISNHYGAIPDITKALALKPNDDSLLGNRAMCYVQTEQWNNAIVDANKAISINSKVAFYFLTRGIVHAYFNRKKESCLDFSTAGDLGDQRAFELLKEYCTNK
jgi:tetratricopeptide (TPR) repeat protein